MIWRERFLWPTLRFSGEGAEGGTVTGGVDGGVALPRAVLLGATPGAVLGALISYHLSYHLDYARQELAGKQTPVDIRPKPFARNACRPH
jgi:hypothetical protein